MSSKPSTLAMLRRLWRHVSLRRRLQFAVLFGLITVASIMEIFSIGAVLPFLGVMIAPEHVYSHPRAQWIIGVLDIHTPLQLLFPMAATFVGLVILSTITRLAVVWATARLTFATGADFSNAIYQRTLYQPYAVHIARNSSEVITGITAKSYRLIHNALLPALTILSSAIMIIMVMSALLASPRLVVEAMGMVLIVVLAMWLNREPGGLSTAIPILGALAIGAQRLLPVLQQAYGAWVSLQGEVASVHDAIDLLDQPLPDWALKPAPPPSPERRRSSRASGRSRSHHER